MEKLEPLQITDEMKNSRIYRLLQTAETVCFVGDSLTEGTINGGVPWYEPIRSSIRGKIVNISQGGATTKLLLAYFLSAIVRAEADLVVVAAGANDILFRDPMFCAMTAADYIQSLKKLRDAVCERRPDAKFVFIAPWIATDGDAGIIGGVVPPNTDKAYVDYTAALQTWCEDAGDVFIDANGYIVRRFALSSPEDYLIDFIHPNAGIGVRLYAEAVLKCDAAERMEC
ncbi:MAG: SGNH/GDSL hydrolase family protein [Schwartzia sp.]|nr:SGNH/GDSL hydrolase family protein [Schwartzia sp. (in: firmicutes)]